MRNTLLILFTLTFLSVYAQDINRISISGKIVVTSEDKEGVTVFNSSSNKGTLTDESGNFIIDVALNDVVEFGALQFEDFKVVVTDQVLISQKMTVILVEDVNRLDEVVILPFGLSGSIDEDIANVRTYNVSMDDVYFGLDHISDFEFSPDYKTKADNLAFNESNPYVGNMLNLVNITGYLFNVVIDDFIKLKRKSKTDKAIQFTPFRKALDQYSFNYIHSNFNIPLDQVEAFVAYVDAKHLDDTLFENNKELELLEAINQLSTSFVKLQSEKK